jgi:signal peptidase I
MKGEQKLKHEEPRAGSGQATQTPGSSSKAAGDRPVSSRGGGLPLGLRWFLSRTIRHALQMRKHVWKLVSAQRDVLSPQAVGAMQGAMDSLRSTCREGDTKAVVAGMDELEKVANKWLKPYPFSAWRENVEVLLVAIAVAMGIRTFFLQPFKIPTGSMQPTLYGITSIPDLKSQPPVLPSDFQIPNKVVRFFSFWLRGISYTHVVATADGSLRAVEKPKRFVLFNLWQRFQVGDEWYWVWFPTDDLLERTGLVMRFGEPNPRVFKTGEDIMRIKVVSGDHLFVDRFTYNFRRPHRGDVVVFETKGIDEGQRQRWGVPGDQYYIKRLVALGGETVMINSSNRLVIDGKPLTSATHGFEKLYGSGRDAELDPRFPYIGHLPIERFQNGQEFSVPKNSYLVMGDNTRNSLDSRYWGSVPRDDVIGKSFFVYWPFGSANGRSGHFGLGYK